MNSQYWVPLLGDEGNREMIKILHIEFYICSREHTNHVRANIKLLYVRAKISKLGQFFFEKYVGTSLLRYLSIKIKNKIIIN